MERLKNLPGHQRPRERLARGELHLLADTELLSLLLGSGTEKNDALMISDDLLSRFGNFRGVARCGFDMLKRVKGIGDVKAARIMAAFEMSRRSSEEKVHDGRVKIGCAGDIAAIFMPRMRDLANEIFMVLFLDSKNRILDVKRVADGAPSSANPDMRRIVSDAFTFNAVSVVCMHNHPSGDPAPSMEDISFTAELSSVMKAVGVIMLDHIVFGDGSYVSFKEKDLIK
ncbi:MAG TPA: DNA repair protein RadC [Candidatus Omnitrophota bacterium]|nr:DNA repair protein RadC [Candidatus Omnitrophota bacterium]HPS20179.1 DNA repair protein RadC [Candidatus Omnitrophota bacterium]